MCRYLYLKNIYKYQVNTTYNTPSCLLLENRLFMSKGETRIPRRDAKKYSYKHRQYIRN